MADYFPEWIRRTWGSGREFADTKAILQDLGLHTVCQSARCPNIAECWRRHTATFMVLGNVCTRHCAFCSVTPGTPGPPEADEPGKVAEAVRRLGIAHTVVTMVTRDDLPDGGAEHMACTVAAIRTTNPGTTIEVLVSDFEGAREAIRSVLDAAPEVFGHNIETVERLYPTLRDARYDYGRSLDVLRFAADQGTSAIIKSAFMVGHGESEGEVRQTLEDLHGAGCTAVAIGQYLRPTGDQPAVVEFVHPGQFEAYERLAYEIGFAFAATGPFVRSSYRSEEVLAARPYPNTAKEMQVNKLSDSF